MKARARSMPAMQKENQTMEITMQNEQEHLLYSGFSCDAASSQAHLYHESDSWRRRSKDCSAFGWAREQQGDYGHLRQGEVQ